MVQLSCPKHCHFVGCVAAYVYRLIHILRLAPLLPLTDGQAEGYGGNCLSENSNRLPVLAESRFPLSPQFVTLYSLNSSYRGIFLPWRKINISYLNMLLTSSSPYFCSDK